MSAVLGARATVGMPVYNGERYLAEAIESFLTQTFREFRLIVADNASTDGTQAIAREYAERDSRVSYVRNQSNIGVARNYRLVLGLADTEYFRWAAADDLAGREALARCVEVLDADRSVVLAYPKTMFIGPDGAPLGPYEDGMHLESDRPSERFIQVMSHLERCNPQYGLARTAVMKRVLPLGAFRASDYCFLAELSLYGRFHEVPERLFLRRFHEAASSAMNEAELRRYYRPETAGIARPDIVAWRHYARHVRAVSRAPIRVAEKWRVLRYVARRAVSRRDLLLGELNDLISWPWRAAVGNSRRPRG